MTAVSRRDVLLLLGAVTAFGCLGGVPGDEAAIDLAEGREIGEAYLASRPGISAKALRAELLPDGLSARSVSRMRTLVAADFRQGRVFEYGGWRLSETEGQLFAILTSDGAA